MNQKSIEAGQPEQKLNSEQQNSIIPSPPAIGNTNVGGSSKGINILLELLVWYQGKGDYYRQVTLLEDAVNDFLSQRAKKKIEVVCNSLTDVKENVVSILGLIGNPNLKTKEDVAEIDNAAMEIYDYLNSVL